VTQLSWDVVGQRFYEIGVDRGVLYVDDVGYAWNGLVSVEESPSGGEAKAYYIDGVKYLNLSSSEEYEATISAFYSPEEFDACDGVGTLQPGLQTTQQPRKSFGFSYRTKVANDVDGVDHGYKIHIVYNALALPAQRNYETMNDNPEAPLINWSVTTKPVVIPGMARSAHFVIDSRFGIPDAVENLEEILYGTSTSPPTLPTPDQLLGLFTAPFEFIVTDLGAGVFNISSGLSVIDLGGGVFKITHANVVDLGGGVFEISSP
jgi:hypothetical protein